MPGVLSERVWSRAVDVVFLRYIAASVVALGVDLGGFLVLLRLSMPATPASAASYSLGIIVHWVVSSRAVFGDAVAVSGPARVRQKALFTGTALIDLALTSAIVGTSAAFGIDPRLGKLAAIPASFITTWAIRRKLIFV
ncbi:MAG: hypothetical protein JWR77_2566 [Rhizorhabdus sp.]|jgi:putative flippase GtrA|nr:hypothetical protein [Rhizorhabdus sp.]